MQRVFYRSLGIIKKKKKKKKSRRIEIDIPRLCVYFLISPIQHPFAAVVLHFCRASVSEYSSDLIVYLDCEAPRLVRNREKWRVFSNARYIFFPSLIIFNEWFDIFFFFFFAFPRKGKLQMHFTFYLLNSFPLRL